MKPRDLIVVVCALCLLMAAAAAMADDQERPQHGKIVSIDKDAKSMVVQGEKDDQWTLYWTESTKLKGNLTVEELQAGDVVHFAFVKKEDKMWLTELHRDERAKDKN